MSEGVRTGGFAGANAAEKAKQAELAKRLADNAQKARQHGETEWQQQIQTEQKALEDDTVVSSTAVKDLGQTAGWDQKRVNDALARHDQNKDSVFSEDEFDLLAAEMEPEKPEGYTVESGDSLSAMTTGTGRDASRWNELYEHNKGVVGDNPNLIHPGQQLEKPPGWVIEDAKIDPAKPTHQVPDRLDEMLKRDQVLDAEVIGQAKQALGQVPADSPKRAEYEQKVAELEKAYEAKWNPPAPAETPPAGGSTPPAGDETPPAGGETPPAGGTTPPAGGTTPPADGTTPPADGTTPPAGGTTPPAGGTTPPAGDTTPPVDPQVKADYDQLLKDPDATRSWDAARKGNVQEYAEAQVDAKLKEADDTTKSPQDRRAAAEAAEKIATDTINAAERAGHFDLASGMVDKGAKAQEAVQKLKIATGDQKAVEDAIDDAGKDKGKLKAIAEALPKDDPRAKTLMAIADGKVNDGVAEKLLDALKDQDSTRGDIAEALQRSGGDKAAIEAIGALAEYKAIIQSDAGVKAEMEALAKSMKTMANASDAVRKELAKGFDGSGNLGDYERAVDHVGSKEDLEALKAFVDHKKASEKGTGADTFRGKDPGPRIQAAIENWDALKGNPEVVKQVRNLIHDDSDNKKDIIRAGTASGDPATLRALSKLAEAVGEFKLAANLLDLTDAQYNGAAPGTREAVLERD